MPQLAVEAGMIDYYDTGGSGPVVVFLHGVVMDGTLWRNVVPGLQDDLRCIVPTLPLGAHRTPMEEDADLSLAGQARIVAAILDALDVTGVTLVNSDWGGSQIVVAEGLTKRVERLVLTSCEAFDNYPPGLPGRMLARSARMPGGLQMAFGSLKVKAMRRSPMTWGHMSKRPIPDEVMDAWFDPILTSPEIRRDFKKYSNTMPSRDVLLGWADRLGSFEGPALVVWASEDKIMPVEHGRRMAEMLPHGRLVEIDDSYTLIPEDRPDRLTEEIRGFVLG